MQSTAQKKIYEAYDRLFDLAVGKKPSKTPSILLKEHVCGCGRKITDYNEVEFMLEHGECGVCDKNKKMSDEEFENFKNQELYGDEGNAEDVLEAEE